MIKQCKLVFDPIIKTLCPKPYYNHPKGCPNYGKKIGCPPDTPDINFILNLARPVYVIYNKFNLLNHIHNMEILHPDWSDRQLYCCLYWQPRARKVLNEMIYNFLCLNKDYIVFRVPEAYGVNVTQTMRDIGEILEWPPINFAYQVALAGIPIGEKK